MTEVLSQVWVSCLVCFDWERCGAILGCMGWLHIWSRDGPLSGWHVIRHVWATGSCHVVDGEIHQFNLQMVKGEEAALLQSVAGPVVYESACLLDGAMIYTGEHPDP